MTEKEKQHLKRFARNRYVSLTKKYYSLKNEIIASFGDMCDKGYGRFSKAMKIKVRVANKEERITFTGLKKMDDGSVYFENNRKKVLYDCSTASVNELMRIFEEINTQLF